ncbi:hypothetical protein C8Q80DRAFT_626310 [Daedaleopsis nitida]|nr:hypothetical protein C8Q80DRAFT_626310 [Daedaleopsis nitida]
MHISTASPSATLSLEFALTLARPVIFTPCLVLSLCRQLGKDACWHIALHVLGVVVANRSTCRHVCVLTGAAGCRKTGVHGHDPPTLYVAGSKVYGEIVLYHELMYAASLTSNSTGDTFSSIIPFTPSGHGF